MNSTRNELKECFLQVLLVLSVGLLWGCMASPDTAGTGTATPPVDNFAKVGDQIDKADARVSAGVQVARNANAAGKAETVEKELAVVASYLPQPDPHNLAYISERVRRNDPAEYKRAMDAGAKLFAVIDASWAKAEADASKNKAALDAANKSIAQLKADLEQSKRDIVTWTCAGIGGCLALAAVILAWKLQFVGAGCAAVGSLGLLATPSLLQTPWFLPSAASLGGVCLMVGIIYAFKRPKAATVKSDTDEPPAASV